MWTCSDSKWMYILMSRVTSLHWLLEVMSLNTVGPKIASFKKSERSRKKTGTWLWKQHILETTYFGVKGLLQIFRTCLDTVITFTIFNIKDSKPFVQFCRGFLGVLVAHYWVVDQICYKKKTPQKCYTWCSNRLEQPYVMKNLVWHVY